jgi:hypothetical protein
VTACVKDRPGTAGAVFCGDTAIPVGWASPAAIKTSQFVYKNFY